MRATLAAVAGAALVVGATVGPTPRALAEPIDWSIQLSVSSTSWSDLITTNFLGCADLPIRLTVAVSDGVVWNVTGQITGAGSSTVLETFAAQGTGPASLESPVQMCEHFNGPVAPPNNEYEATATVRFESIPTEQSASTRFTIRRLWSHVVIGAYPHELRGGVSALVGRVQVQTNDGFIRPAPVALVTAQRLEGSTWIQVGESMSAADGNFVVTADRLLPAGTYVRFQYPGDQWVAPHEGFPWQLREAWTAPSSPALTGPRPAPVPRVKVRAVSSRSKLKVDVNPNVGRKYWTFQVQRRNADGTWKALKTYRTRGSSEKRTINLPKGTYRVWVNPKFDHQGVMSAEVTLKR